MATLCQTLLSGQHGMGSKRPATVVVKELTSQEALKVHHGQYRFNEYHKETRAQRLVKMQGRVKIVDRVSGF